MELFSTPNVNIVYENEVTTLTINKVNKDHSGVYRCLATNDAGEDEVEAEITVEGNFMCLLLIYFFIIICF